LRNITSSADEQRIEAAREQAAADNTTLNDQFRRWLEQYARRRQAARAMGSVDRMRAYVRTGGRKFTREQMNER
jgi:chromosomal replication initiation ATPase DnaA